MTSTGDNLLAEVKHRGRLVVSTDADYAPQSFRNPDGTWKGFDVDVAREIARRLGVSPDFQNTDFGVITAGGWQGRWDVNVDSMAITPDRSKKLWFTRPYYYTPASFAVYEGSNATTLANLEGKRIGVGKATTYQDYLSGKLPLALVPPPHGAAPVLYSTDAVALQDLASGSRSHLDAVLTALPTIRASIAAGMPLRVIGGPVFYDASAIAFDRSSPEDPSPLLWAVDAIVADMHRDGTLRRLSMKYYGLDLTRHL
jgi:polar amino acid transport system substrate-binding protein